MDEGMVIGGLIGVGITESEFGAELSVVMTGSQRGMGMRKERELNVRGSVIKIEERMWIEIESVLMCWHRHWTRRWITQRNNRSLLISSWMNKPRKFSRIKRWPHRWWSRFLADLMLRFWPVSVCFLFPFRQKVKLIVVCRWSNRIGQSKQSGNSIRKTDAYDCVFHRHTQ